MTLAHTMMFPSSFLQNFYVALVEHEKGSPLCDPLPIQTPPHAYLVEEDVESSLFTPETHRQPFELAVRITSLAHAALQFVCAAIETVPLLAVTTATVLFNASNSGFFSRDGGRLERVVSAALAALASMWLPVGTSLWAVLNPSDLSDEDSLIQYQFKAQALLFSFTLPSLPRLADHFNQASIETLKQSLRSGAAPSDEEIGASREADLLLERADTEAFDWRTRLAQRLEIHAREYPAYLSSRRFLSVTFNHDLREAVTSAARYS